MNIFLVKKLSGGVGCSTHQEEGSNPVVVTCAATLSSRSSVRARHRCTPNVGLRDVTGYCASAGGMTTLTFQPGLRRKCLGRLFSVTTPSPRHPQNTKLQIIELFKMLFFVTLRTLGTLKVVYNQISNYMMIKTRELYCNIPISSPKLSFLCYYIYWRSYFLGLTFII